VFWKRGLAVTSLQESGRAAREGQKGWVQATDTGSGVKPECLSRHSGINSLPCFDSGLLDDARDSTRLR
jgi:hypothetical protein